MARTLYHLVDSASCDQVRLALAVEGLPIETVAVEPADRSRVLKLSGQGELPVLVEENGDVVVDAGRILRHLAARPGSKLLPEGRRDQAFTWVLVDRADTVLGPLCERLAARAEPDGRSLSDDDLRVLERRLGEELAVLEGILERGPFLFGDHPTVADVAIHSFLGRIERKGGRPVPQEFVRVAGWYHRVREAARPT